MILFRLYVVTRLRLARLTIQLTGVSRPFSSLVIAMVRWSCIARFLACTASVSQSQAT